MSDTITAEEGIRPLNDTKSLETDQDPQKIIKDIEQEILDTYITAPLKIVETLENEKKEETEEGENKEKDSPIKNSTKEENPIEVPSAKTKKSVSFNPNDEEIRKFTTGEPIVDQKNPFRNGNVASNRDKKTPPPVPTKRSTLSVRKTVTQQLREREREREKEREQQKNESNTRKNKISKSQSQPDDYVTTEEVLKQSKYVKTYIKNPDAYFVYDPTVLARLKLEELKEATNGKLPKRKQAAKESRTGKQPRHQTQNQNQKNPELRKPQQPTFKKCSKPNYPELANLKIRTGTNSDPESSALFNPAEVTKNARKFDERVKKLQITSDDDLDDIDGPLTKSESSDELAGSSSVPQSPVKTDMSGVEDLPSPSPGVFTNTINSDEFQAYLDRKGLALMPRRELFSPTPSTGRTPTPVQTAEERRQQVAESLAALRKSNTKKLSVLQRLSNSLFPARRKTTPKSETPMPRSLFSDSEKEDYRRKSDVPSEIRRILLERQSPNFRRPNGHVQSPTVDSTIDKTNIPTLQNRNGDVSLQKRNGDTNLPIRNGDTPLLKRNNDNTLRRSTLERPGVNPRRQWPEAQQVGRINRSTSVDRSQFSHEQPILASPVASSTPIRGQNQWDQLRAIKEVTDRQLYHKLHQQQQLQGQQMPHTIKRGPSEDIYTQVVVQPEQTNFVRGTLQRNTFSGISGRSRPLMVFNGTPQRQIQQQQQQQQPQQPPRCHSVMDNLVPSTGNPGQQTPVIMRHRGDQGQSQMATRRIGGLLTREEILEKVKEFCRKSITKIPETKTPMQPVYKRHLTPPNADVSPVSYASVDDQCARPQAPHRTQGIPVAQGRYIPGGMVVDGPSPIYAHVSKRNSLLSNVSEQYLSSQQLGTLARPVPVNQLVLVDTGEGVQVAQLVDYLPYVRPAPSQGYMMQDGRATPLILDQSAQQTSQIYWTPQHRQRISHPVPAPRLIKAAPVMPTSRNSTLSRHLEARMGNASDWELSSEAGEVRRIMEKQL
ncbi:uncharacterized protein LOC108103617 [Drosophila eugracilis]|uniref:uncharacterized protein LOC108103617 n=1 Tax=Drosophila eugracilis TaxID=29029 RepID=UPI0007E5D878|nr:uncharacterized protein LOC108103617 [Drosophila eugracilis]XP_017064650.1 uncharacterized protein LOC108103617 [Drosophila eugracilis]